MTNDSLEPHYTFGSTHGTCDFSLIISSHKLLKLQKYPPLKNLLAIKHDVSGTESHKITSSTP